MHEAFNHIGSRQKELKVTLRETAIAVGVERIAEATEIRGLFP
jgi:glutamate dehydrogenase/leucine dehydrogenase